jgi:hypothetical protein
MSQKPIEAAFSSDIPIKDFVFPVCDLTIKEGTKLDKDSSSLVGTAFLIGGNGFAITAAHVVDQTAENTRSIMRTDDHGGWWGFRVISTEKHPTEDVAIIKIGTLPGQLPPSPLFVSGRKEFASKRFQMWGYPESVAKEVEFHGLPPDHWKIRPDLTFFSGYVHRRMPFSPNPSYSAYVGKVFFEISEVAGSCASGSPIIADVPMQWDVFALYVGEANGQRKVGYGVSLEHIADWKPNILGRTIREEALETAQKYANL